MLKNILKLEGATSLSKEKQKSVRGGGFLPFTPYDAETCRNVCGGQWDGLCMLPEDSPCVQDVIYNEPGI
ncbi:hypothetical protein [uncultured Aquimarina sp.]|uniref:hypothetical protein n=1 Tax=uncultured Aquimarina sp. TaxID=575652 RepID=UPI00260BB531|nr:hypothetical protein [uncultured Aquimarina sp.]